MTPGDLEQVARDLVDTLALQPPVDALELAKRCGLELRPGQPRRDGSIIYVPMGRELLAQQWFCAHELGHWALERAKERQSEDGASYIAAALLIPKRALELEAKRSYWDLARLSKMFSTASTVTIARRMTFVLEGCAASVHRPVARPIRYGAKHYDYAAELELVERAWKDGEAREGTANALRVKDARWSRVVAVGIAKELTRGIR